MAIESRLSGGTRFRAGKSGKSRYDYFHDQTQKEKEEEAAWQQEKIERDKEEWEECEKKEREDDLSRNTDTGELDEADYHNY